ncbi:MAG: hypothetical protein L6V88_08070 [Anaerotruncus sp.]|nr:MAG: hypothetical protein L6V88_08070 [Anaerotruncus sp.]
MAEKAAAAPNAGATSKKYMSFKEVAAYSLGLFGFQAIVGLLNSYQAEFDGSILGANVSVVAILILVAKKSFPPLPIPLSAI